MNYATRYTEIDDEVLHSLVPLLIAMGEEFVEVETLDDIHALGFKMSPRSLIRTGHLAHFAYGMQDEDARETLQRILTNAEITRVRLQQTGGGTGY